MVIATAGGRPTWLFRCWISVGIRLAHRPRWHGLGGSDGVYISSRVEMTLHTIVRGWDTIESKHRASL